MIEKLNIKQLQLGVFRIFGNEIFFYLLLLHSGVEVGYVAITNHILKKLNPSSSDRSSSEVILMHLIINQKYFSRVSSNDKHLIRIN